jgi:hypothetical protein
MLLYQNIINSSLHSLNTIDVWKNLFIDFDKYSENFLKNLYFYNYINIKENLILFK